MPRRVVLLLLVALLVAAGCGGEGSEPPAGAAEGERRQSSSDPSPRAAGTPGGDRVVADELVRAPGSTPQVSTIARGLEVPWDITFLPDRRALVTERPGRIRLIERDGTLRREPVARVPVQALGEGGLMGIDVDPDFAEGKPFVYVMATRAGQVRVLRYRWDGSRLRPDGTVLDGIRAGRIHDSGRLRFGPDERLYVVTGDAGVRSLAQRRSSLNGKVLSLSKRQYRSSTNRPRIVSIGHRNPQGLDWQPGSGRLFVTEHGPSGDGGPSCCDETNVVRQGGNYLWPRYGRQQRGPGAPEKLWMRTIAPSGSAFVSRRGSSWTGDYLVAALRGQSLRRNEVDGRRFGREQVLLDERFGRLRAVVEAPDGAIWVTTSNLDTYGTRQSPADDRILRILPPRG